MVTQMLVKAIPLLFAAVSVAACGGGSASTATTTSAVPLPAASSPTASAPAASESPAATGGVTIYDHTDAGADGQAMYELVTPTGRHVYLDVVNWTVVAQQPTTDDLLLITHDDIDHLQPGIVEAFPGRTIVMEEGSIDLPDIKVQSVPTMHDAGVDVNTAEADNYAFVMDIGGVRVVHFGDTGQTGLTPEQAAVVGRPDIAFSQIMNPYANMDRGSTVGIEFVNSVNPRLFIPTHLWFDEAATQQVADAWPSTYTQAESMHFDIGDLPETTHALFSGVNGMFYPEGLGIAKADF
jgi:L-ascorbate metabolism protein UlaG (beta-lactamase superfamily)